MIFDQLQNLAQYKGIHKNLDSAIDCLLKQDLSGLESGRYEIDGERVFFFIQDNELNRAWTDEFEFHKSYLDLHFLLEGEEIIRYGYQKEAIRKPYDAKQDIGFAACGQAYSLTLDGRNFAAFLPDEAHQPNQMAGREEQVRKCVVKVLLKE